MANCSWKPIKLTEYVERKKILLSAYACSPIRGSEPGNGWSWATGLAAKGFEVWCFTNVEAEKEILEAHEKLNMPHLHMVFIRLPKFLDRYLLDTNSKKIYPHYSMWQMQAAKVAKKMHASIKFDIAHHVTFGSLQQGNFLWKLKDVKIIFGPVGGGQKALPLFKEYFGKSWKIEKIRNLISGWSENYSRNFKNSILRSDYVLVSNPDTFEMALKVKNINENKIHFVSDSSVPASMENMPVTQHIPSEKLKLLWVGRMLPRKGLNLVLESLSHLPQEINYELTIVGGGEQFHLVEEWIKQYGIVRDRINITGQIPFEKVSKYYKDSDVFIFCSLRDSFGSQITEAMAFGLPLIVLNIHGAVIGVPPECGIKITPVTKEQTLKDIASAISKMYYDVNFRTTCGSNALLYSKENTWQKRIDSVVENFY